MARRLALIEGYAFIRTPRGEGTLSYKVWKWMGVKDKRLTWWVITRRVALLGFLAWLLSHLAFGWP